MQVNFIYDYRSVYAYLANSQLASLGVSIDYQPVDIVWIMRQVDNQPTPKCPPKSRYAMMDAQRWADIYGIPLSPNAGLLSAIREERLPDGLLLRVALASKRLNAFSRVNDALFRAVWAGSDDLISSQGQAAFIAKNNIPAEVWELAQSPETDAQLRRNNENALQRGVFGAPTFYVGNEMFFGNDRLDFVKLSLKNRAKENIL